MIMMMMMHDNDKGSNSGGLWYDNNDDEDDNGKVTLHRVARSQGSGGIVAPGPSPGMTGVCEWCPPSFFVYLLVVYDRNKVELQNEMDRLDGQ